MRREINGCVNWMLPLFDEISYKCLLSPKQDNDRRWVLFVAYLEVCYFIISFMVGDEWHFCGILLDVLICLLQCQGDAARMRNSTNAPNIIHCCTMRASTLIHALFEVKVFYVTKLMIRTCLKNRCGKYINYDSTDKVLKLPTVLICVVTKRRVWFLSVFGNLPWPLGQLLEQPAGPAPLNPFPTYAYSAMNVFN